MKNVCTLVFRGWGCLANWLDRMIGPLADLGVRLYLARVFFMSGLTKIQDWDTTLALFHDEYHVPLLPPELAAVMGASGELALPVLLTLGIATRFAAGGLFVVNAMAAISYYHVLKGTPGLDNHVYWGMLLLLLLVNPARQLTADYWLAKRCGKAGSGKKTP